MFNIISFLTYSNIIVFEIIITHISRLKYISNYKRYRKLYKIMNLRSVI